MKYWTLVIGLIILFSCQTKEENKANESTGSKTDTISVTHKRYWVYDEIQDTPDVFDFELIKEQKGDSILSFRYYLDTVLSSHYDFNVRQGKFELIQEKQNPKLAVVDTFEFNLADERLIVFKYEVRIRQIDGGKGFLFNQKYGLLGYSAYSWGSKTLLTKWNGTDFEKELTRILLADTVRYLSSKRILAPLPPGQSGKIEIVEDTVEIELEDILND